MKNGKKPSLVLVSEYFYPANNAPGARFKPLAEEFARHFNVVILTSNISKNIGEFHVVCNWVSFPSNKKSSFYRLLLEFLFAVETFLRLTWHKGDLYYITSPSFINCMGAAFHCWLFRKKYVVDVRDDYPRVYFDSGLIRELGLVAKLLMSIEKKIYSKSQFVIAATEGLKRNIEKIYPSTVYLLRNGFSERLFIPSTDKYGIFTLVFHGNLSRYQDINLLIELGEWIDKNHSGELQIIVIGHGYHSQKLEKTVCRSLSYLGSRQYSEIPEIIAKAHVGLSFRVAGKISEDSFPVKTYEYIGVALPIIATPISEAGAFIESEKIGFQFSGGDKLTMFERILELKNDTKLYQGTVGNIMKSRYLFSREKMSKQLAEYLTSKILALPKK